MGVAGRQYNPRQEILNAIDKNKALVLDLYCEHLENWRLRNNFDGNPWHWCSINCFGGNDGLGVWLADARSWGATPAEKDLCERNARELLTTWASHDNITDYANRQWNGLLREFYYRRWAMWLEALNHSLATGVPIDQSAVRGRIRDWELWWTR